jgi:aminoglycoside phosphotransferase
MRRTQNEQGNNAFFDSDHEQTSSEEDFEYLQWELNEKKFLPLATMKMLRGVV